MRTPAVIAALTLAAAVAAAPVPKPDGREAAGLVEALGSAEFDEREAAGKRLEELGVLALTDLRAACLSENPEIASRAKDLVRKIERRASSDRALAPTVVELDAKDAPLDAVLAALSKQAGCEVVLGGLGVEELAAKKVTVATGKAPFWSAVLKVCDAADLQVAGAGGFVAPGAMPYRKPVGGKVRAAADANAAVVLEARDGAKRRPASVHGAVLVEAFEPPKGAFTPVGHGALLQFWPEPQLAWQAVANLKITRAADADGRRLAPDLTPPPRLRNGTLTDTDLRPTLRQAVAKFKPGDAGPVKLARELSGSAYGLVRTPPEPLVAVALDPKKAVSAAGQANAEMTAALRTADGKTFVDVTLAFPPTTVDPVKPSDALPDLKPTPGGNRTVLGVRVTDADGAAFTLALAKQTSDFDRAGRRVVAKLSLELVIAKDGPTVPAQVTFWGTTVRPVEVPFVLKDVPLR
jgi:hypothetical protein